MTERASVRCHLLSREWRDGRHGVELTLWGLSEEGPVKVLAETEPVMFVPRRTPSELTEGRCLRREPIALRTMQGEPVDALYFQFQRDLVSARDALRTHLAVALESDVKPSDRFVMERFVTGAFEARGVVTHEGVIEGRPSSPPTGPRVGRPITVVREARVKGIELPGREALPRLTTLSIDLETDLDTGEVLSFAFVVRGPLHATGLPREEVVVVGEEERDATTTFVVDERALLETLIDRLQLLDPDVIVGWNVIEFDLTVLEARCHALGIPFALGRHRERARVIPGERGQVSVARIPGRVVLDGIATLKNATFHFERYTLEHVSRELLGRGKKLDVADGAASKAERLAELRRMAREDRRALAAYNLEDARLVADIFDAAQLQAFAFSRAELVGLPLDRQGGSVASFDHLYLPRLHRAGFVAPDVGVDVEAVQSPGGEVLESVPGLHRDVLSFDFRSLYPSLIRTFRIDPLGLHLGLGHADGGLTPSDAIPGFDGARFAREPAILPQLIEKLTTARKEAIASGNEGLSRAIKIQMNSFYGVLGTPGCRFFDPRLASSITRRGHQVIHRAKAFFEERGMRVLYGDTDSVFVDASGRASGDALRALGASLAAEANEVLRREIERDFHVESALELRFDAHFASFLMPTMRGSDVGSKKRYAGAVQKSDGSLELVFRGLEAVRTDWTPLARRVQRELFRRVFVGEPWEAWLEGLREDLFHGKLDAELVYRKRIRRDLDAYAAAPPHVKAARLRRDEQGEAVALDEVEYVMTTHGALPIEQLDAGAHAGAPTIDYGHYVEKQLAPACDVILAFLGTSFQRIAGTQLSLF